MKRFLKQFAMRGCVGVVISNVILCIALVKFSGDISEATLTVAQIIKYIAGAIVIGIVFGGTTAFFEWERLSMLWATVLHFVSLFITYTAVTLVTGWHGIDVVLSLEFIGSFVLVYVGIWLAYYFTERRRVRQINERLKNKAEE